MKKIIQIILILIFANFKTIGQKINNHQATEFAKKHKMEEILLNKDGSLKNADHLELIQLADKEPNLEKGILKYLLVEAGMNERQSFLKALLKEKIDNWGSYICMLDKFPLYKNSLLPEDWDDFNFYIKNNYGLAITYVPEQGIYIESLGPWNENAIKMLKKDKNHTFLIYPSQH